MGALQTAHLVLDSTNMTLPDSTLDDLRGAANSVDSFMRPKCPAVSGASFNKRVMAKRRK